MVTRVLTLPTLPVGLMPVRSTVEDPTLAHAAASEPDDQALVAAMAAGDVGALDLLYCRYRAVALAVAYQILRDRAAAEDVVHDAILRFWRAASSFRSGRGSPRGWLLTIVRNAAIDSLRARARTVPTLAPITIHPASDEDVALTVTSAAEARRLGIALATLPGEQRQAIELAYYDGLTHSQIAEVTGVPLGTVKGRVRLGLRRLRQELQDVAPVAPSIRTIQTRAA
jgi:RNA polymerase sigma-70 factor, ECF subfamily